jgi:mRNA interferase MazF
MGKFVVGDVVAVPFPFSDLSGKKLRPALVLAVIEHDDLILCQITSRAFISKKAIELNQSDFLEGNLPLKSYIRTGKLFTAEATIIQKHKGKLQNQLLNLVLKEVQEIFKSM